MNIETATEKHLEAMVELLKLYFDFYEVNYPSDDKLQFLVSQLAGGTTHGIQFIAYEEEEPIGFSTLYFTYSTLSASKITIMNDLYVKQKWRGTDVAKSLFEACTQYSKDNGYSKMEWVTAKDNFRGQGFYDKMGGNKSEWLFYNIETI